MHLLLKGTKLLYHITVSFNGNMPLDTDAQSYACRSVFSCSTSMHRSFSPFVVLVDGPSVGYCSVSPSTVLVPVLAIAPCLLLLYWSQCWLLLSVSFYCTGPSVGYCSVSPSTVLVPVLAIAPCLLLLYWS